MDNLAHALVGAAVGRAVAGHRIRGAGLVGAVAGNAPDWTELIAAPGVGPPRSGLTYLEWHRGITHSLLGAAIEIAALTLLVWLGERWWSRRRGRPAPPWSWLAPLVALLLGERRHWRPALVGLLTLGGVAWLVLSRGGDGVAGWLRLLTLTACGLAVVGWVRHWFGVAGRRRAAGYGLLVLGLYVAANAAASVPAKAHARDAAQRRFGPGAAWAALTVIGRPFHWTPLYASADSVAEPGWAAARHLDCPAVVRAVRDTPQGRAMAQFARFLTAEVDSSGPGVVVYLRDARYARAAREGWGVVAVRMDRAP